MKASDTITDFLTGREIPNIGAEMNRQAIEQFLVNNKGFDKKDLLIDHKISLMINGEIYRSTVDIIVAVEENKMMVIKCAAGSLGSRERETLAVARLIEEYQVPYSIVSDGKTAIILDTIAGKKTGEGLDAIPSKEESLKRIQQIPLQSFPPEKKEREKLIFRSYDSMIINVPDKNRI
ncbi:MAG: hypothetical protein C4522_19545 [Desulfobacteraceae bacterium]|nr:MAG: hypothetical protein C4522_19545 [Desulfobacteraceae bacterium]